MKISAGELLRTYSRPDPRRIGLLIFGADAMRVAMRRKEVIAAVVGLEGEAEMRLARMAGTDLRRDPAMLVDALKAQGFFPGPRVAFVEDATDGLAPIIGAAMEDWREGDALIVVTAGSLAAKSALRKLFDGNPQAHALGIYDDPPGREEIEAELAKAGLRDVGREVMADLTALAHAIDPGDFRQTLEKIALYKASDPAPLSSADIAACAPATLDAEVDDVVNAAATGRTADIVTLMRRLDGQGVSPVTLCLTATRHFRTLHSAAADPAGAAAALARARPPVFGPRRDALLRQVQQMGLRKIEDALGMMVETDMILRSSSRPPEMALVERTLIRLAEMVRRN
ncbi:MAG: DNA polymerase III subunit delta [Cereibacter sphaeroides]|uniref:DNA-directed DNA polymerase n=1 Tax=Cereibacter sphaeroides TaxID=1063 RepID=A0A2W5S1A7_CERSP|nr:MAG: DNA polymerase III subunit delta [Cereibacter sphaeroides]